MSIPPGRFSFVFTLSTLFLMSTPASFASNDNDVRDVRISSVQGDVRLSRGDGKHTALNKPWEQAQGGELLERGFAVATGSGRAEIEFENGSAAYLADNSLLLFRKLSAHGDRIVTRMVLPTGTATFSLQPVAGESFFIETPTDKFEITSPDSFFGRMDAYLDATAITPQGEKGENVVWTGLPKLMIPQRETVFFRGGEIVQLPTGLQAGYYVDQPLWIPVNLQELQEVAGLIPGGLILRRLSSVPPATTQRPAPEAIVEPLHTATRSPAASDWDNWVSSRIQERAVITTAALKASGLSSPIPGLNDLFTHGSFFHCEPYGTCWEPAQQQEKQAPTPQASPPAGQSTAQNSPSSGFQPQTVEWLESTWGQCDFYSSRRISRVARTQQEFDDLLRLKAAAEHAPLQGAAFSDSCWNGVWIRHHGHFARVLTPRIPPRCVAKACKPVHPPRPLFVRVGGKVGFVPRHPNDVKGKPPLNLKNGILLPPAKPGEPIRRVAVDSSQKFKILDKVPRELQSGFVTHAPPVAAPEIRGHLMQEAARGQSTTVANRPDSHVVYDYKSQKFMMPTAAGAKAREVPVGGIARDGKVASFADGHSGRYADSFGRTSAAASYNGGHNSGASYSGRNSGSYSSGASYSGGGGYSGSHSSGSYGGSSLHSSGGSSGGGSVSTSGSSSSSASSSSSGGGSRGRP